MDRTGSRIKLYYQANLRFAEDQYELGLISVVNVVEKDIQPDRRKEKSGRKSANRSGLKRPWLLLLLLIGLVLAGLVATFVFVGEEAAEPYLLLVLGLFAVVGIFTIFCAAIGLIRLGEPRTDEADNYSFLDSLDGAHVLTDGEGRVLYADPSYRHLIGAVNEYDVRSVERVFGSEEGASEPIYRLAVAAAENRAASEEIRLANGLLHRKGRRGTPGWYRISVRPVRDRSEEKKDKTLRTIWRVEDISHDRADQEVAFLELQNVINYLDHAPVGFFSAEADGKLAYMNATLSNWLQRDLAEFDAGEVFLHDIIRGDGAALLNAIRAEPGEVRTETFDIDFVKGDGTSMPVRLLHLTPFQNDGAPGPTRTVVLDKSRIVTDEEDISQNQALFSQFFNAAPIAIAAIDQNGKISRMNAPFVHLFGKEYTAKAEIKLIDIVPSSYHAKLEEACEAARQSIGEIAPVEVAPFHSKDKHALVYFSAVTGTAEDVESENREIAILYAIDTTQQRAMEQQFAQGQKMQAIGQLAGGIAHDFNNMLTAIIGFSDLLLQNHGPTDPSFQDIMNIKNNANRAAGLVRQLLAFSRRQTLRPTVIDVRDIIEDLSILLERLLGENVRLLVNHGRDLWAVRADQNQLEQVIINLSVNARDAMSSSGDLKIVTRNFKEEECDPSVMKGLEIGQYVLIEVTDTGTGMTPEIMEKIFDPFFSTKDVGQGTGLGLSTVYGIIKQTEGYIYPISKVGVGTTFQILLPRYIPTEKDVKKPEIVDIARDLSGSAKILLVEDEEAVRAFSARALQARGHTVYEASSGVEALEVMEEVGGEVDLVVSDVVMPEMDGPTLMSELRKVRPDLKIIFVSGYAEEAFEKHLDTNETFAFLAKPFSLKQLATKVKEVLDSTDN